MYILQNQKNSEQLRLDDAHDGCRDHITWEIESACNLGCKYCYPSRTKKGKTTRAKIKNLIDEINRSQITNVHITGGEPTQSTDLEYIIQSLHNKRIYITTNLVRNIELVEHLLESYKIHSVAISLDSIQMNVNDALRGKTDAVLNNIARLVAFKRDRNLQTQIRIHCVVSKLNLVYVPELLLWARSMDVDEVSCQPISIEKDHEFYNVLHLECKDINVVREILQLENSLFNSTYASSHYELLAYCLRNEECFISDCGELCSSFIDANGDIWNCPRKLKKLSHICDRTKVEKCEIIPQCMTCLKRLVVLE